MISEKLQNAINEQITAEMWSSNLYLSMSFYLQKEGFDGFASWMRKQSQEESRHVESINQGFGVWIFVTYIYKMKHNHQ